MESLDLLIFGGLGAIITTGGGFWLTTQDKRLAKVEDRELQAASQLGTIVGKLDSIIQRLDNIEKELKQ